MAEQTSNPKQLLLLRHGKSEWPDGVPDRDRPLGRRGRRDARRVGEFLRAAQLLPDLVVTSPANRARDTAIACVGAAGLSVEAVREDERLYDADPGDLLAIGLGCLEDDDCARVMLVSHNPTLDRLLTAIEPDVPLTRSGKLMTTASLAIIGVVPGAGAQADRYRLEGLIRPADLPA